MSSPFNVDGADGINNFLQEHQRYKEAGFLRSAIGAFDPMQIPRSRYPDSLTVSELERSQPRGTRSYAPYAPSRGSSEGSGFIADLDRSDEESQYSISTAPSRWGVEPLHLQRPTVPHPVMPPFDPTPSELPGPRLPCEFFWYADCHAMFELDEDAAWVQHVVSKHLHGMLPKCCICWFCDETDFKARSGGFEDKKINYAARIRHIAHHFRQGETTRKMRPDHRFLDHIHGHNLISEAKFQTAREYHEAPQPRNGINTVPFVRDRQGWVAVELRSRRGHRESQRSYRD